MRRNATGDLGIYTAIMAQYPVLSPEETDRLFLRIETGTEEERQEAIRTIAYSNIRLVVKCAFKHSGRGVAFSDLVQEGMQVLIEKAIPKFDRSRGRHFSTYASPWLRQAMARVIENTNSEDPCRLPVRLQHSLRSISTAQSLFSTRHGRMPTADEIYAVIEMRRKKRLREKFIWKNGRKPTAEELADLTAPVGRLSVEDITRLLKRPPSTAVSLDRPIGDEDSRTFGDTLSSDVIGESRQMPFEVEKDSAPHIRLVTKFILSLKEKERDVLVLRHGLADGNARTLEEVAASFDLTRERIRQIQEKAQRRLGVLLALPREHVDNILASLTDLAPMRDMLAPKSAEKAPPCPHPPAVLRILEEHAVDLADGNRYVIRPSRTLASRLEIDINVASDAINGCVTKGFIAFVPGCDAVRLPSKQKTPLPNSDAKTPSEEARAPVRKPVRIRVPAESIQKILEDMAVHLPSGRIVRGGIPLLMTRLRLKEGRIIAMLQRLLETDVIRQRDGWRTIELVTVTTPEPAVEADPGPQAVTQTVPTPIEPAGITLPEIAHTLRIPLRMAAEHLRVRGIAPRDVGGKRTYDPKTVADAFEWLNELPTAGTDGTFRRNGEQWIHRPLLPRKFGLPRRVIDAYLKSARTTEGRLASGTPAEFISVAEAKRLLRDIMELPVVRRTAHRLIRHQETWLSAQAFGKMFSSRNLSERELHQWLGRDRKRVGTHETRDTCGNMRTFYRENDLRIVLLKRVLA